MKLEDLITYPYEENGQEFTVVQPKDWEIKTDLSDDGIFASMNRKGRFIVPINRFRDVVLAPSITSKMFERQRREIKMRSGDITIATFPRSGTTWTEQIVCLILNGGNPDHLNTPEKNAYNSEYPDRIGKVFLDALYNPNAADNIAAPWGISLGKDLMLKAEDLGKIPFRRVFKTHHRAHMLIGMGQAQEQLDKKEPPPITVPNAKFIWVMRDPKDVALSMMKMNSMDYSKHDFPIPAYIKLFLEGKTNRGVWLDHTREWYDFYKKNPTIVLPLTYERNKKDPMGTARKIAQFLDIDLSEEQLENCVKYSSFEAMKEMSKGGKAPHVMNGRVGGWRGKLSDEMIERFNEMVADPVLEGFGNDYIYPL